MAEKDKFADEVMSDDELDGVAGGGTNQTAGDYDFLAANGFLPERNTSIFSVTFDWSDFSRAVDQAWSKAGVTCVTKWGSSDNQYFIYGKEVSRKDAFRRVLWPNGWNGVTTYDFEHWRGSFD